MMDKNTLKKVKFNFIFSIIGQIVTIGIGIIIPRLYIVSFGSEINGFINSINQIFIYVALLEAGVGGASLQALYKPVSVGNKDEINGILSATHFFYKKTGIAYLSIVILLAVIYPLIITSSLSYWLMVGLVALVGVSGAIPYFFQAKYRILLQAEGKNYVITFISTFQSIILSSGKLVLLMAGCNVLIVQSLYLIINLIISFIYCIYIKKNYRWINLNTLPNHKAISKKNAVIVHQISSLIFNNTDVLILTFFCDLSQVSIYVLYKNMIGMVGTLLDSFLASINFKLGQTFHKREKFVPMINAYENFYVTLTFSLLTITYFFIRPFMKLYTFNMDIDYMIDYFPLLMILAELLNYGRMVSLNIINYAGHFKQTQLRTILESVINLCVSIYMVKAIGLNGVVIGTIVALLYRTVDMIYYSNKIILQKNPMSSFRIWIVNIFFSMGSLCLLNNIGMQVDSYASIVVNAIIVSIIIVPLQQIYAFLCNRNALDYIKNFFKRRL